MIRLQFIYYFLYYIVLYRINQDFEIQLEMQNWYQEIEEVFFGIRRGIVKIGLIDSEIFFIVLSDLFDDIFL